MTRLALILITLLVCGLWLYTRGGDNARADQLERSIENAETFNEGASNPDDVGFFERLFPTAD